MPKVGKRAPLLPRQRLYGSVPNLLTQLVEPIYLGMHPLPITANRPLLVGKDNESVANFGGISVGSVAATSKSPSSKRAFGSSQRINFGSDVGTRKKRSRKARAATKSKTGKKKKVQLQVLKKKRR